MRRKLVDVFHSQGSALACAASDSRPPGDPPTQSLAAAASG
jgi:hypothetical protein